MTCLLPRPSSSASTGANIATAIDGDTLRLVKISSIGLPLSFEYSVVNDERDACRALGRMRAPRAYSWSGSDGYTALMRPHGRAASIAASRTASADSASNRTKHVSSEGTKIERR